MSVDSWTNKLQQQCEAPCDRSQNCSFTYHSSPNWFICFIQKWERSTQSMKPRQEVEMSYTVKSKGNNTKVSNVGTERVHRASRTKPVQVCYIKDISWGENWTDLLIGGEATAEESAAGWVHDLLFFHKVFWEKNDMPRELLPFSIEFILSETFDESGEMACMYQRVMLNWDYSVLRL